MSDIRIIPNRTTGDPVMIFSPSGTTSDINLYILTSATGLTDTGIATLSFEGSQGQLFSITDQLESGVIFSVNDIGGLPLIEADASGYVYLARYGETVGVGQYINSGVRLLVSPGLPSRLGIVITGVAGQTADLFEVVNSSNNMLFAITSNGNTVIGSGIAGARLDVIDSGSNATPTLRLMNLLPNDDPYIRLTPSITGNSFALGIDDSDSDKFKISFNSQLGTNDRFIVATGGQVGINNSSPLATLDLNTLSSTTKGSVIKASAAQSANLSEWQNNAGTILSSINSAGNIFTTGSLSIRNESPLAQFHVNYISSSSLLSGVNWVGGIFNRSDATNDNFIASIAFTAFNNRGGIIGAGGNGIQFATYNGSSSTARMLISSGGDVGIGTSSPSYRLDVQGGAINAQNVYRIGGQTAVSIEASSDNMIFGSATASTMTTIRANASTIISMSGNRVAIGSGATLSNLLNVFGGTSTFRNDSNENTIRVMNLNSTSRATYQLQNNSGTIGGLAAHGTGSSAFWGGLNTNRVVLYANSNSNGINLYADGNNSITFCTSGTSFSNQRAVILANGNFGINTQTPFYILDVNGVGNFSSGVRYPDGITQVIAYTGLNGISTSGYVDQISGDLNNRIISTGNSLQTQINNVSGLTRGPVSGVAFFTTNGILTGISSRFIFDSGNSRLSIGTGVFGAVIDIVDTGANTIPTLRLSNLAANFDPYIRFTPSTTGNSFAVGIDNSDSDKFKISYGADLGVGDMITVTTGGYVGIGTTSPLSTLQVSAEVSPPAWTPANKPTVYFTNAGTSNDYYVFGVKTNGGDAMAITNASNVSIGHTAPLAKLHVNTASSSNKGLIIRGAASQSANLSEWQNSAGTVQWLVDPNGKIGINRSRPTYIFDVGGSGRIDTSVAEELIINSRYHAGPQAYSFANGIYIITNISSGDNTMVELHVQGNSYDNNNPPVLFSVQCYNYIVNNDIINRTAINYGRGPTGIDVFYNTNSFLCFWFKQTSNFQTYRFFLGTSNGPANTKITSVNNAVKPATLLRNYTIIPFTGWNSNNDGAGSNLDADLLDGQQGAYYTGLIGTSSGDLSNRIISTGSNLQTQINNVSGLTRGPVSGIAFFTTNGILTGISSRFIFDSGSSRLSIGTGVFGSVVDVVDTGSNLVPTLRLTNLASNFDPYIRFTPASTGNSFAIGIDDSDEDKFKISYGPDLGIGDAIILTTGGNVGINTGSPQFTIHVNGTGAFNAVRFSNGTVQTTAFTGFPTSSVSGPANTIAFFTGGGALTGSSSLTYDPLKTSFTLTTQGSTPSTGFVILNHPDQSGNVFQIRSYVRDVNATTYTNQYTSNTGDGSYTSNAGFNATNPLIDLIQGSGSFCTGFFPFSITGYVPGKTVIEDGATFTVYNNQVFATGLIEGELAIYTGDANPANPANTGTLATQVTKLSTAIPFSVSGSGSSTVEDLDLSPLLNQYFNLYPANTGNILLYYTVYSSTGSISQNAIASANNGTAGLRPKLDVSFTVYEYAGTTTNKPIYSVDHVGRIKVGNIERSDQLINSFLFYASGEPNQAANIQIESQNNNARVLYTSNNTPLFSAGTTVAKNYIIRDEKYACNPLSVISSPLNHNAIFIKDGYLGVKTSTPIYALHVNGGSWVHTLRLRAYANVNQVPETARTLYSVGGQLYWNGSQLALGGDSSYTWTVRDGSNNSEVVADSMTVHWSGAGTVSTLYTAATNIMRISGSPGWNLGVGNAATVSVATNNNVTFTGLGNVSVSRNGTQITISGASAGGASGYDWKLGVGSESTSTITSGNTVNFSGTNGIRTTRSTNQINIIGPHSVVNSGNVTTNAVINLTSGTLQTFTLTGNTTFTVTGVTPGARFMLRLEQGSVGNYSATFNFPSGNIKWPGGSAPAISTGVGNATLVGFVNTSGTFFYDGFIIATGIR